MTVGGRPFDLVASDLDGTLLSSGDSVSTRTLSAMRRVLDSGAFFVFATGRPPRWIYPVAEETGHHSYAVGSNGAVVLDLAIPDESERVLHTSLMSPSHALTVVEAIRSVSPRAAFAIDGPSGFGHDPNYVPSWAIPADYAIAPVEELIAAPVLKVLFKDPDITLARYQALGEVLASVGSLTFGSAVPVPGATTLLEVMAPNVSKASALQWICEREGISSARVLAFGDMPNDSEMLAWAGHGVAMGNAHEEIKSLANAVTHSNDDHGVAAVLESLF
jgi:Cof subfamily protein (haloacid dehalogenase superfamily)